MHDPKMWSLANPWCHPNCFESIDKGNISLNESEKKNHDHRLGKLWYQNRINSQICKEKHRRKYFPLIPSQSKQIFIFSFVTILSAYGFFCRLPLWSSLCVFKDNKPTFWPSVGWQKCKMFIGRVRNMISGWFHVHLLMNISEFTQCPETALVMNHYAAPVFLSIYCHCCCFRQKHSFISPTPFPVFWINLWEEIIYCMV